MTDLKLAGEPAGLIRVDERGRLLVRAGQRAAILEAFDASPLSAAAFCRQHGLSYSTFSNWMRARRRTAAKNEAIQAPAAPPKPAFTEVFIDDQTPASIKSFPPLRIALHPGASVEITGPEQIPLVVELIQALNHSARPC